MQRQALENSLDDVQRELIQARAEKTEAAGSKAVLETKVEDLQVNFDTLCCFVFFVGGKSFFVFRLGCTTVIVRFFSSAFSICIQLLYAKKSGFVVIYPDCHLAAVTTIPPRK